MHPITIILIVSSVIIIFLFIVYARIHNIRKEGVKTQRKEKEILNEIKNKEEFRQRIRNAVPRW